MLYYLYAIYFFTMLHFFYIAELLVTFKSCLYREVLVLVDILDKSVKSYSLTIGDHMDVDTGYCHQVKIM